MNKLRVGVVGVGALGQHHARTYAALPQVELVAVADSRPGRAAGIGLPLGAEAFTDYRALFGKVEAVSVTGVWRAQWLSPWGSGPSVVVHEFTHAFVNPAVQAHRRALHRDGHLNDIEALLRREQ